MKQGPQTTAGSCETCRFWDYDGTRARHEVLVPVPYDPEASVEVMEAREVAASEPFGECAAIEHRPPADDPSWPTVRAFAIDASDYHARVITRRDFGCVSFKERP